MDFFIIYERYIAFFLFMANLKLFALIWYFDFNDYAKNTRNFKRA